jgi:hypothetical protein
MAATSVIPRPLTERQSSRKVNLGHETMPVPALKELVQGIFQEKKFPPETLAETVGRIRITK